MCCRVCMCVCVREVVGAANINVSEFNEDDGSNKDMLYWNT